MVTYTNAITAFGKSGQIDETDFGMTQTKLIKARSSAATRFFVADSNLASIKIQSSLNK